MKQVDKSTDLRHDELAIPPAVSASNPGKRPFVEPKLIWIEPKLVKQGDVTNVTAGFFGTFYP